MQTTCPLVKGLEGKYIRRPLQSSCRAVVAALRFIIPYKNSRNECLPALAPTGYVFETSSVPMPLDTPAMRTTISGQGILQAVGGALLIVRWQDVCRSTK